MRDEKGNITIKSIYKWLRSEKGKKYSFAIFYLLFFIILFVFFIGPKEKVENSNQTDNEENLSLPFITSKLENNGYNFTYIVEINNKENIYQGKKSTKEITLTNTNDDTFYYEYQNGELIVTREDELLQKEFLDIYDLKRIFKNAELISEVKYPSTNQYAYNYEITGNKLGEILEIDNNSDVNNEIIVETNSYKEITKITLNILNYMNSLDSNEEEDYTSYKVTITYGDNYE